MPEPAAADDAVAHLSSHYRTTLTAHLPPRAAVCVALSGGMDSCALLEVARQQRDWQVSACHINHGLSARAPQWEAFCQRLCAAAGVPLSIHRTTPPPHAGEAWARAVRREVFAGLPVAAVLAAHHADDQAETLLLRLLRGSGWNGIAAMRSATALGKVKLLRPWLEVPRRVIADYAQAHKLHWVEDEDNRNLARRRNAMRWQVLPLLERQAGGSSALLTAAARRLREGADLLAQLAQADAAAARQADGGLALAHFRALGAARLRNYLYAHLQQQHEPFSERLVYEAARQALGGKCAVQFGALVLHCWRDALYWETRIAPPPAFARQLPLVPGRVEIAELGGALHLYPRRGGGLSPARVGDALTLRLRRGGEMLAPPRRPHRRLTALLQEAAVPPWQRPRLPLLFAGEELAAVSGVAVAAAFAAKEDEVGIVCDFEWGLAPPSVSP